MDRTSERSTWTTTTKTTESSPPSELHEPRETPEDFEPFMTTWHIQEDRLLCVLWSNTPRPLSGSTWEDIHKRYSHFIEKVNAAVDPIHGGCVPHPPRGRTELQRRWTLIQPEVLKFSKFYHHVEPLFSSTKSADDILIDTLNFYERVNETSFEFIHCYSVLSGSFRWQKTMEKFDSQISITNEATRVRSEPVAAKRRFVSTGEIVSAAVGSEETARRPDVEEEPELAILKREASPSSSDSSEPLMYQILKKRKLNHQFDHQSLQLTKQLLELQQQHLEISRKKADIMQSIAEDTVMSRDYSKLDSDAVTYYQIRKKQILDRLLASIE